MGKHENVEMLVTPPFLYRVGKFPFLEDNYVQRTHTYNQNMMTFFWKQKILRKFGCGISGASLSKPLAGHLPLFHTFEYLRLLFPALILELKKYIMIKWNNMYLVCISYIVWYYVVLKKLFRNSVKKQCIHDGEITVIQSNLLWKMTALVAVCMYHYVITMGLWSKYDINGHYFIFTVRILANH